MNEIELKARELLKAECPHLQDEAFEYGSMMTVINLHVVMRALRAALTPPDGCVLVPECHTPAMDDAGCLALFGSTGGKQSAQVWKCWDAMLAARPEVRKHVCGPTCGCPPIFAARQEVSP